MDRSDLETQDVIQSQIGVVAIVPAAGSGSRLNAGKPKALVEIHGQSILRWTIMSLLAVSEVDSIVVAIPSQNTKDFTQNIQDFEKCTLVNGGQTRQESVRLALESLKIKDDQLVLIHDAARCLVAPQLISACIKMARSKGAVTAAITVVDSLRRVMEDRSLGEIVERENLWAIQTPQVFRFGTLRRAHEQFKDLSVTDDASLVGLLTPVEVVEGDLANIKVTTVRDLELAQTLLSRRL